MGDAAQFTILVVEDSEDIGSLLAAALEEEGCAVHIARNGHEVVNLARELRPSLITLDLGLPGKSGSEIVEELRADAEMREIPVIAVSAHESVLRLTTEPPIVQVIQKPFYLSDVVTAVLETLGLEPGAAERDDAGTTSGHSA